MNNQLQDFARVQLKESLNQLPESWQLMFKRMYSEDNLDLPIGEVVDKVPEDKLDWAMQQVERSLEKRATKTT